MDRDKDLLSVLSVEALQDFRRVQTHKGWEAFWRLLQASYDRQVDLVINASRDTIWEEKLKLEVLGDVIGLREDLLNRGKVEEENAERERRERRLSGHPESGIPGWAGGFRRGPES